MGMDDFERGRAPGIVVGAMVMVLMIVGSTSALSNSGGGSWQHSWDITISNPGSALTEYQILVSLDSSNFPTNAQSSSADIRFMDINGNELSYWIESWDYAAKSAKIWVKVPSIPAGAATTIHMHFGNPSASSSSNGDATFEFFDDFESGNLNKWDSADSGMSVVLDNSNRVLKLYSGDPSWKYIQKNIGQADIRLDLKYKIIQDGNWDGARFGSFLRSDYRYELADWHFLDTGRPVRSLDDEVIRPNHLNYQTIPYYSTHDTWYHWGFSVVGSGPVELKGYGKDGEVLVSAIDTDNPLPAGQLKLWIWDTGATDYVDDVRVRKFASLDPSVSVGNGLVVEYHFDGNTLDSSGNGNDGTNYGATFVDGVSGQALSFDGVDDYVETTDITADFDLRKLDSHPWTLSFWAKSPVVNYPYPSERFIFTQSTAYHDVYIEVQNGYVAYFLYEGGKEKVVSNIFPNVNDHQKWHEYVFSKDENNLVKLYVDGDFKNSGTPSKNVMNNINELRIGGQYTDVNRFWNGIIDEVRIYSRALSAEEIKKQYEEINKKPPIASFNYMTTSLTAYFTSTSYDHVGTIDKFHWNFGDGRVSNQQNPTHSYFIKGSYPVTLTVTDNEGNTASITEIITVGEGIISKVNYPLDIPFGEKLTIEVNTNQEIDITLDLDTIQQTKYGKAAIFSVDTASFTKGEHNLKISAGSDSYTGSIIIYDPAVYQIITNGLEDLAVSSKDEMREISGKTGHTLTNHVYNVLLGMKIGNDKKVTASEVLNNLRDQLRKVSDKVTSELENYKNMLSSIDSTFGGQVDELDSAINLITNIENEIDVLNEKVTDEEIINSINKYVTKPAIYTVLSGEEVNLIDERTQKTKSILAPEYTQAQLDQINEIYIIGKEAIANTDGEQVYNYHIGNVLGYEISAKPTLDYLAKRQEESLSPPEDSCILGICIPGKYNPTWIYHLTVADAESILTIPAYIGWIDATPNDEIIRPMVAPVLVAGKVIKMYMKYVDIVEKVSPWLIDGGMIVSTDLLSKEVNEEHADIIQAIYGIIQPQYTGNVVSPNKLSPNSLYVPGGNILITTSPDGKIRDFQYIRSDSTMKVENKNRVISLNTGWSQTFDPEPYNVSIAIKSDKSSYTLNEKVNLTVNINSDVYIEDTMVWLFIPEANTTIKDIFNVTIGDTNRSYNFTIQNEIWHVPRVYLSEFGTILAENYTKFGVGSDNREAGLITLDDKQFYDPGTVEMNVTIHNTGNVPLDSKLIYFVSNQSLTDSTDIPVVQVGNSITMPLIFEIAEPEVYEINFILLNNVNLTLDYNMARFTVIALDTLLAFPSTDKVIYNASSINSKPLTNEFSTNKMISNIGEAVNIDVVIKNITLDNINIPYFLRIKTPTGDIINSTTFIPEHNGTYIIKARPLAKGYSVVEGRTLFIVGEQSNLAIETDVSDNITRIKVKTDAGGSVEDANVVVNGYELKTDKNGEVLFVSFNTTQLVIKAEKFGFYPAVSSVILEKDVSTVQISTPLIPGWNLISPPLNLTTWQLGEESTVGNLLNVTPTNCLSSIYRYNTTTALFEKSDHFDNWGWWPATGSESFTELEPGRGYWVMAQQDCSLTFTGTAPSDLNVPLESGWNLIGRYFMSVAPLGEEAVVGNPLNVTPANSLTSIYRYNTTSGLFEKSDHFDNWGWWPATGSESFTALEPGRGYWVMAQDACEWKHEP